MFASHTHEGSLHLTLNDVSQQCEGSVAHQDLARELVSYLRGAGLHHLGTGTVHLSIQQI